ncbi:hypothetical protein TWF102_009093 [Orbilia oligospora]|uniref:Zn(2)-C6 fungal-type domain-containing protein n=1 Tax=Orbilia oligospora TaxID=2813651 RepID=A0A7C8NK72_ORBOL|nr:hypothetical protein TWF102_009093 [Orbilia oligospora]
MLPLPSRSAAEKSTPKLRAKRHAVVKACDTCRRGKTKCAAEIPKCARCQSLNKECQYALDTLAEEKHSHRSVAYLRHQIELESAENRKYREIIDHMRTTFSPSLGKTINLIQSQSSIEDMLAFICNDGSAILPIRDLSPPPQTTELMLLASMEKENHSFCSPLLANSVLAMACHFSNRIPIRSDPHNPNTL